MCLFFFHSKIASFFVTKPNHAFETSHGCNCVTHTRFLVSMTGVASCEERIILLLRCINHILLLSHLQKKLMPSVLLSHLPNAQLKHPLCILLLVSSIHLRVLLP